MNSCARRMAWRAYSSAKRDTEAPFVANWQQTLVFAVILSGGSIVMTCIAVEIDVDFAGPIVAYGSRRPKNDIGFLLNRLFGAALMARPLGEKSRRRNRRGAALTELAICLPILSIVTLGSIEAANGIYVRQKLVSVSYDLARGAAAHGDTSKTFGAKATALFKTYGIKGGTYSLSPSNLATAKPGDRITITVSAPMSRNSIGLTRLYGKIRSSASLTMTKG